MLVEEFYSRLSVEQAPTESGLLVADLASSSLFALMHFPGWFALGNFASPPIVADTLSILVFGWPMKETGFLWLAYLLHTPITCSSLQY